MASLLVVGVAIVTIYLSIFIYNLLRNLINARRSGLPYIIVPLDPNHTVWQLFSIPFLPYCERWLPKAMRDRISIITYGWEFREKLRPFKQYASPQGNDESYMLVTCGGPEFWTCDPQIVTQVLSRTNDFQQSFETVLFVSKRSTSLRTTPLIIVLHRCLNLATM